MPRWLKMACLLVLPFLALFAGLAWYNRIMLDKDVDFLFQHVLAQGDAEVAYRHADVHFRALYPYRDFTDFVESNPSFFERDKVNGKTVEWLRDSGGMVVVLTALVDAAEVKYFCRPMERGEWRLVGIAPGLERAVPKLQSAR
ncbi:MAG: hypothetical protein L0215_26785 [Gemmataceae bacterium]|nr:hypothetical protein [Gemmataceae bacterium]